MEDENAEVAKLLSVMSKMSSFLHTSGLRTGDLQRIATQHNLKLLSMPKIFTIRWTEFTYRLARAVLTSWHALMLYFGEKRKECSKSAGFLDFISNERNMRKICFIGDVLFIFMRMQKKLQNNSLTLIQMSADVKMTLSALKNLIDVPLLGGFEANLDGSITTKDGKCFLKNIELTLNTSPSYFSTVSRILIGSLQVFDIPLECTGTN